MARKRGRLNLIDARVTELPISTVYAMGLSAVCPDFGTLLCADCTYGENKALANCDYGCGRCWAQAVCPCSLTGWMKRTTTDDHV